MNDWQIVLVIVILAISLAYAGWRVFCVLRAARYPENGCPGCPLLGVCNKRKG